MDNPTFINRDGMITDKIYVQWLSDIKHRLHRSRSKAVVQVNRAMLDFYWSLGRDIVNLKAESKWGNGFFNQLSLDLKEEFPNEGGFSVTNLKYIKRWYVFYSEKLINRQRPIDELQMPENFALIPWGQHIDIFSKCDTLEKASFYISQCIANNWSRPDLAEKIKNDLFGSQGAAITNFATALPDTQSKIAQSILKDPYNFDFLTIKEKYDEKELEDALVQNITKFLLELGQGFAFVGRQKELCMPDGTTFYPDLIFYHIPQKRYVVVELKAVKFMPEFAGKINFYVSAVDELLKDENDNPTIGLVICKSSDKTIVEWSFRGIERPVGVATYQLQEVVDRTVAELEKNKENK